MQSSRGGDIKLLYIVIYNNYVIGICFQRHTRNGLMGRWDVGRWDSLAHQQRNVIFGGRKLWIRASYITIHSNWAILC